MKKLEKLDNDRKPTGHITEFEDEVANRLINKKRPFWQEVKQKSGSGSSEPAQSSKKDSGK